MKNPVLIARLEVTIYRVLLLISLMSIGNLIAQCHFMKAHCREREKSYGRLLARESTCDIIRARQLLLEAAPEIPRNSHFLSKLRHSNLYFLKEMHDLLMDGFDSELRRIARDCSAQNQSTNVMKGCRERGLKYDN